MKGSSSLILLLLIGFFALSSLTAQSEPPEICPGDVNLDGERGIGDLGLLSGYLAGEVILGDQASVNADVNLDDFVDVGDQVRLLQHATGEFLLVPCGEFAPVEVACPELSIGQASAAPLEEVHLGSLPKTFNEPILALVTEEKNEIGIFSVVERLEDGSATFLVPFHPGSTIQGGAVHVQITDGMTTCPLEDFAVEAIPPAPGEFSRVVDALQEDVESRAAQFGLTKADLTSAGEELPPQAIPMAIAQRFLDHPENPYSLRAVSEGTAPFPEGATDNTILDAVSAHVNLVDLIGQKGLSGVEPAQGGVVDPLGCGDSVEKLDECMRVSAASISEVSVAKQKALFALFVLKLYPVPRNGNGQATIPDFEKVFLSTEVVTRIPALTRSAAEFLLPSKFSSLETTPDPVSMNEDTEKEGEWKASLKARSIGLKFPVTRSKLRQDLRISLLQLTASRAVDLATKFTDFEEKGGELKDRIEDTAKKVAPDRQQGDAFEFEPESFGPVEILEEEWSTVEIRGDAVEQVDHNKYRPLKASDEAAPTDIIVTVGTDGGRFGGVPPIKAPPARVEVLPIELIFDPSYAFLEAGDLGELELTVKNSSFPEQIDVKAKRGGVSTTYLGGNKHRIRYTAPAADDEPDVVTATHTAKTGARRLSTKERTATASLAVVEVIVTGKACVEPGKVEPEPFVAQVVGFDDKQVTWSATDGVISQSGVFTAPDSPGNVVITATSFGGLGDNGVIGEAFVKVGGCDCRWTLSITSSIAISGKPGDSANFSGGDPNPLVRFLAADGKFAAVGFSSAAGTATVGGTLGVDSPDIAFDGQDLLGVLFENSEAAVEGSVEGTVLVSEMQGDEIVEREEIFVLSFRLENDEDFPGLGCKVKQ